MNKIKIPLKPLSKDVFASFGDVIEVHSNNNIITINDGAADRHHDLTRIDVSDQNGYAIVSIIDTKQTPMPLAVKKMERHPIGSQAFIPTGNSPYVVLVAPAGKFNHQQLQGFLAQPHQGINYAKGTWHHACISLNRCNQFLVIDRGGQGENCDFVDIPNGVEIIIESGEIA
jgi:ureidoglycolate lyase